MILFINQNLYDKFNFLFRSKTAKTAIISSVIACGLAITGYSGMSTLTIPQADVTPFDHINLSNLTPGNFFFVLFVHKF